MGTIGALPFSAAVRKLRAILSANWGIGIQTRNAPIIVTVLRDIPHPGQGLVTAFFDDLEVADLDTRYRKVRNLKLHRDGCSLIDLLLCVQLVSAFLYKTMADLPPRTLGKPKWARIKNSRLPASCFIFQTNADLSGAYCTLPVEA
jgi:hypothetical protein